MQLEMDFGPWESIKSRQLCVKLCKCCCASEQQERKEDTASVPHLSILKPREPRTTLENYIGELHRNHWNTIGPPLEHEPGRTG